MPEITIKPNPSALARHIAEELLTTLLRVQGEGHVPSVCLTGGTIAGDVYAIFAELGAASDVDWARVDWWWGDERFVAEMSADRNDRQLDSTVFDELPVPAERIHRMPSAGSFCTIDEAATNYAHELASAGAEFDIVLLGMGPDGHIASLFPGYPEIKVIDRLVTPVLNSPKPPEHRLTLTLPQICRGREVWLLVAGVPKAPAVRQCLEPVPDANPLPAGLASGTERTVWFLDEDAASMLSAQTAASTST